MKRWMLISFLAYVMASSLQIRLSHDAKRGYSYQISGPELEEVIETDKKLRQYLKSQIPRKEPVPAPAPVAPKPAPPPIKR